MSRQVETIIYYFTDIKRDTYHEGNFVYLITTLNIHVHPQNALNASLSQLSRITHNHVTGTRDIAQI